MSVKKTTILPLVLLILLFFLFFLPSRDPDLGWELRCGRLFLQNHDLCTPDQFSFLLPGYQWINSEYLYQAVLYLIYQQFSLWGLSLFCAFLLTASFVLLFKSWVGVWEEKIIALFIIIVTSWSVFSLGIRAQLFSFFFFCLVLFLLTKLRQNKFYPLFILPIVFLFWANTHGGFLIGLFVYGVFLIGQWLTNFKQNGGFSANLIFLSFIASVAFTLINPFGHAVYTDAVWHETSSNLGSQIAEWVRPDVLNSFFIVLLTFAAALPFLHKSSLAIIIRFFGLLVFSVLALSAQRHILFFYIMLFTYYFSLSPFFAVKQFFDKTALTRFLALIIGAGVFAFSLRSLPALIAQNTQWSVFCYLNVLKYPCGAISYLKKHHLSGNIFNRYEWGGFLDWQMPESKIFADGRMPAWQQSGKGPYLIYLEVIQTQPGWQKILTAYHTQIILIEPGTFLDLELTKNPVSSWKEVYRDQYAVAYVNNAYK